MKLLYAPKAFRNLEDIRRYISRDNPRAAAAVVHRIRNSSERLRNFPMLGHAGYVDGTLEHVVPGLPYVLVYRVEADIGQVTVLSIYHGAQERTSQPR